MSALARKIEINPFPLTFLFSLHRSDGLGKGFARLGSVLGFKVSGRARLYIFQVELGKMVFLVPGGDFGLLTDLSSYDRKAADRPATAFPAPVPIVA